MRRILATLALALPLLAAACGDSSTGSSAPTIEETEFASSLNVDLENSVRTSSGLYYRDLTVGTGATATAGKTASVYYWLYLANGQRLQTNEGSSPLPFRLGSGGVIAGFDEGVTGMKVGGRRQLIIPPSLGYGRSGSGPVPGNAIIVFEVQLTNVQ